MLPGVYQAQKKNGTIYYRSNITFQNKHISLGSFPTEADAGTAYKEASLLLATPSIQLHNVVAHISLLTFEKSVVLLNFRDNGLYFKNPIYLRKGYFTYYLSASEELKFDIDDLFYYSSHKIQKRRGHLFVSDYGMQYSVLARYGIRPYAVCGRDYTFANGDSTDYRYSNIIIINHFHGVLKVQNKTTTKYKAQIHVNGNYHIGIYSSAEKAAIAYNKAVDLAKAAGICKNFSENYVESVSPKEYADIYTGIHISKKYLSYLETRKTQLQEGE